MSDIIEIQFLNWEKYNPRSDIKRPWWFALCSNFPTNKNFLDFTHSERLVFIYLLCETNEQASLGHVKLSLRAKVRQWNVRSSTIKSTIEKLFAVGICTQSVPTQQNKTEQNKTKQKNNPSRIIKKEENLSDDSVSKGEVSQQELNQLFNKIQTGLKAVPK